MYFSEKQIINALTIIKVVCGGFEPQGCSYCPFGDKKGNCIIRFNMLPPSRWEINERDDTIWRAFDLEEEDNG